MHDYLTMGGRKISKSAAGAAALEPTALEPVKLAAQYGTDAAGALVGYPRGAAGGRR